MNCANCENTGSLSKTLEGGLDCPHCHVAELRAELNALVKLMPESGEALNFRLYWLGYTAGRTCKG